MVNEPAHVDVTAPAPACGPARPPARLEAPSLLTAAVSACAVVCFGACVWAIYAAFGLQTFDVEQSVLRPVAEWAASGTEPAAPHAGWIAVAGGADAGRVLR